MPGVIEEYDFKAQKASVKIDMHELLDDSSSIDYPVITDVPIIFPRSGRASFTMPVLRGDSCLVFFLDRDISNWLIGTDSKKPNSRRRHSLNDAVAIMGLNPFSKPSPAKNNTDVLLTYAGTEIALKPDGKIDIHSSKEITIKAENILVNCTNAKVNATGRINTETPNFTQKGNMKIEGDIEVTGSSLLKGNAKLENNIEVTGSSSLKGNVKCDATLEGSIVKTSSGVNLATHKHSYQEAQNGSNPTIVTPSVTGVGV
jgi:hypothetical protein